MSTTDIQTPGVPTLPEVSMSLVKPIDPVEGTVVKNEICTASKKAAGVIRHVEIDVSGTPLAGKCRAGQAFGVLAPGEDAKGKPHKPRLYSLASPTKGEDGNGNVIATTCKRVIDEHWDDHSLFLGVCSNYVGNLQEGDKVKVCGPNGKRFLLPENPNNHAYTFVAAGTGIAPFRGMVTDLIDAGVTAPVTLLMGAPYASDLLYHKDFLELQEKHPNFTYLTAISREKQDDGNGKLYVQQRIETNKDQLLPQLQSEENLVYICGLAGMELGIFQQLATHLSGDALEQYLQIDPEVAGDISSWDRKMIHKKVKPTKRVMMEVYA